MAMIEDIDKGRELFRRKNQMRARAPQRKSSNPILMEIGRVIEFVTSKIRKPGQTSQTTEVSIPRRASPYADVIRADINALLERMCEVIPKQKKRYDPLDAAWRRGRSGG